MILSYWLVTGLGLGMVMAGVASMGMWETIIAGTVTAIIAAILLAGFRVLAWIHPFRMRIWEEGFSGRGLTWVGFGRGEPQVCFTISLWIPQDFRFVNARLTDLNGKDADPRDVEFVSLRYGAALDDQIEQHSRFSHPSGWDLEFTSPLHRARNQKFWLIADMNAHHKWTGFWCFEAETPWGSIRRTKRRVTFE